MTLKGGTSQACAACKYQRRRCTSECPLAPYFPPDQPKVFQNAHRLFGVSNILKILKKLEPDQKATAMWSIIYQSNERDRDPVHGCLGRICHLRYQIWHAEQDLLSLHHRLQILRQNHGQNNNNNNAIGAQDQAQAQQLDLIMGPPISSAVETEEPPMWLQCNYDNATGVAAAVATQEYDEMPFFYTMDDRQSYNIDSKEAYDTSSEESVLKLEANQHAAIEHLVDNELKNAAAGLSLTSVN